MGKPFIKWVGGKTYLLPEIVKLLPEELNNYYEPMLGGGALFFHLEKAGMINKAILSDTNADLINTYLMVRDEHEKLIRLLQQLQDEYMGVPDQEAHYKRVRAHVPRELSCVERAARFIYLNKTCFNGLYRVNLKGEFNVPFGRRANPKICDVDRLKKAHNALQIAELICCPVVKLLDVVTPKDTVYIDPPYWPVVDTSFVAYTKDGFSSRDQELLANDIKKKVAKGTHIVASNSDVPPIRELYKGMSIRTVQVPRRVNADGEGRGKVDEVLIYPKDRL
jgi:DNA adenine methylase